MTTRGHLQGRIGVVVLLVSGLFQGCTVATVPSAALTASPTASTEPSPIGAPSPSAEGTPVPSPDSDASASAAEAADAAAALATVEAWEKARQSGDVDAAWHLLSAYQQAAIGSRAAFAAAEQAYLTDEGGGAGYKIYPVGPISADDRDMIGSKILADVSAVADLSRAFVAHVMHPGAPGAALSSEGLLLAPVRDGGAWRIWIVQ
jgi:hypothetical protein